MQAFGLSDLHIKQKSIDKQDIIASLHRPDDRPPLCDRCVEGFQLVRSSVAKATREEILRKYVCHISSHHCHYSVSFPFFSFGTLAICMIDSKALRQAGSFLFCSVSDSC